MNLTQRICAAISAFLADSKNHPAFIILAALFVPLALLSLAAEIEYAIGYQPTSLFFNPNDRFADILKTALSYKSVVSVLLGSDRVAHWPKIYRSYLYDNPYNNGFITHFHLPPLATLIQIAAAEIIVVFSPSVTVWIGVMLYVALAGGACGMLRGFFRGPAMDQIAMLFVLLFSYPALFMLTRGNLTAGYTNICLAAYVLTVVKGRYRWFGLLCLAAAINIRPNTIALGLMELVVASGNRERLAHITALACLTLIIGYASFLIVQSADPEYTPHNFLAGYRLYNKIYVEGDKGLGWNFSIFATTKNVRDILGLYPAYNADCYTAVYAFGFLTALVTLYLGLTHRLTMVNAAFLGTALSALFTPLFAFYHMTEFAIPLLVVLAVKSEKTEVGKDSLVFVTSLLCLCPLDAEKSLYPLFILGVTIMIIVHAFRYQVAEHGYANTGNNS